jgi:hypothetical protein
MGSTHLPYSQRFTDFEHGALVGLAMTTPETSRTEREHELEVVRRSAPESKVPPKLDEGEFPQIVAPLRLVGDVTVRERQVGSLRLHPSWSELGLAHHAVPVCLKSSTPGEPIQISTSGIVLKGIDQFEALRSQPKEMISCIVFPWDDDEALQWIIEQTAPQGALSEYARILLTRDLLDSWLKELAKENMRLGGEHKGLSNLTNLTQVHRRKEIARVAMVAEGYVSYAARLHAEATEEVKQALLTGELPIYLAVDFLKNGRSQHECLANFRTERTRTKDVRQAIRKLQGQKKADENLLPERVFRAIEKWQAKTDGQIRVGRIRTGGNVLLISNDLLDQLYCTGDIFHGQ